MSNLNLVKNLHSGKLDHIIQKQHEFEQWRLQETTRIEAKKQSLRRQTRQLESERAQLNIEKMRFQRKCESEENKIKREERLLEAKRMILQEELYKLAEEKKEFELQKSLHYQEGEVSGHREQKDTLRLHLPTAPGTLFFAGINSRSSLKRRYKELLKIYHPDNKYGDNEAILAINREYNSLMEQMKGKA